jgi:biopolymer transport protein ExbB/TolQ
MLTEFLLEFALLGAEWVLWILVILSVATVAFTIERILFFRRRDVAVDELRVKMEDRLENEDYEAAAELLEGRETMEARVVLFGLRDREKGPEAVEDRMSGALSTEKTRYNKFLPFLGTVGNNAPFIGLFGTVLGIIAAFDNLAIGSQEAAQGVMGAISEALVATGVGLLVAIPAVIAFNAFKSRVGKSVAQTDLLGRTLLSYLRSDD